MFSADSPFVLLDDARNIGASPARLYTNPVEIIRADHREQLEAQLALVAQAAARGLHAAGYLSYEAGLALEPHLAHRLPQRLATPLLWFGLFEDYQEIAPEQIPAMLPDKAGAWLGTLRPSISRAAYDDAFERVQQYIHAGDIYQANLTIRATARHAGHPLALYHGLRGRAAAGYGGVIFDGDNWILSFSPELFFAKKGERITAKPMKGTAARDHDPQRDALARDNLRADPKQQAENLMIVDLLRNDLSRVASRVEVPDLFKVETYPTIHTMTSTITATAAPGNDAVAILRQIYPCGSITGAPKIRAMEIIDELENGGEESDADRPPRQQRGIYCGSIGRIDADGDAAFNVAIRTLYIAGEHSNLSAAQSGEDDVSIKETLSIGLGSGIVADSRSEDEWRECLAKGRFATVDSDYPVDLIETMAFDPANGIMRLESHLERMKKSAAALEYEFDRHDARNKIQAITFLQEQAAMVRLVLAKSGAIAVGVQPLPPPFTAAVRCQIVPMIGAAADYRRYHKTSDRTIYAAPALAADIHPLFINPDGLICEGAIWNIFVRRGDRLLTPKLASGLLPGILRAELLASGEAEEAHLTATDLAKGFLLGNSVRGLVAAVLVD